MAKEVQPTVCDPDVPPQGATPITAGALYSRLKELTSYAKTNHVVIPVMIFGPPGVGKSAMVDQIGTELHAPVETFIASTMDPTEIRGIPYPFEKGGYSEWFPQKIWLQKRDEFKIFFFDELNLAPLATQHAFYRLILEGKLDQIDISNSMRIAAGNRKSDVASIQNMTLPLVTRFEIYYVEADAPSWLKWAATAGIHERVVNYIREYPDRLFCVSRDRPDMAKATPRSWERISRLLTIGLDTREDLEGSIGKMPTLDFMAYLKNKPEKKALNLGAGRLEK